MLLLIIMIITTIVKNMQNKLFTIHFFTPPEDLSAASSQAEITDPSDFCKLTKFPKKAKLPEKFKFPDKRGAEHPETQKTDSFLSLANPHS